MRTTVALDDELLAKAQAFTGLTEKSSLAREALKVPIETRAQHDLSALVALSLMVKSHHADTPILHDPGRYFPLDRSFWS